MNTENMPNFMFNCKYIPVVHDYEYSWVHPSICVCICASLSPTFVLCVIELRRLAGGVINGVWLWFGLLTRWGRRAGIIYDTAPPCVPLFWLMPPIKQKKHNWHPNSAGNIHHLILFCLSIHLFIFSLEAWPIHTLWSRPWTWIIMVPRGPFSLNLWTVWHFVFTIIKSKFNLKYFQSLMPREIRLFQDLLSPFLESGSICFLLLYFKILTRLSKHFKTSEIAFN